MPVIKHNPENLYPQYQNYSHAIEVSSGSRLLIISGLNGYLADGKSMPETFEEQGEMIWKHLGYNPGVCANGVPESDIHEILSGKP